MAAPTFGTSNPQALDPYPIESVLAKEATGGSAAQAQNMLELYQMQRKAAGNVYGDELQQQHEFARQQLQQQLEEQYLKAIPENAKAGTLGIMAASPTYSRGLAGVDPSVVSGIIQRAQEGQEAETFGKAATGFQHASEGGLLLPQNAVPGLKNLAPGVLTDTSRVRQEQIKAASRAASDASHSSGVKEPGESTQVENKYGGLSTVTRPKGMSDEQWDATLARRYGKHPVDPPAQPESLPGVKPATSGGQDTTTKPATTTTTATTPQNTAAGARKIQDDILKNMPKLAAEPTLKGVHDNIQRGIVMNGGKPKVQQDKSGRWHVIGGDGQPILLR